MYFQQFSGCSKYWYPNLLMISNLYPSSYSSHCLWWSWYFALDFQLFLLASLLSPLLYKIPKLSIIILSGLLTTSVILTAV